MPTSDSENMKRVDAEIERAHHVYPSLQGAYYYCPKSQQSLSLRKDSDTCQACGQQLDVSEVGGSVKSSC